MTSRGKRAGGAERPFGATARRALLATCVWLGCALGAAPALAHAVLLGTDPADRDVLAAVPATIALRFNEPVRLVVLRLLDASGRVVAEAPAGGDDALVTLAVPRTLAAGNYVMTYRVISADAHAIAGALVFAVGTAPAQWPSAQATDIYAPGWRAAAAANRALHFLALALIAGATLFLGLAGLQAAVLRTHLRPVAGSAALLGIVTAAAAILIQGGIVLDAPLSRAAELWRAGLTTSQGRQSIAAVALLLATWQAGWTPRARAVWAPSVIALAALSTLAATGHVVTALSPWLTVPVLLAHALPALLWVGSFAPLLFALEGRDAAIAVQRFARLAPPALLVLVAAGAVIAVLQVRTWDGLTDTVYGQVLLLKSGLVGALLLLAAVNRWRLTPLLLAGEANAPRALRRSVAAELQLGVAIFATTAVLAQTPPPRSLRIIDASAPAEQHNHDAAEPGYAVGAVAQGKTAIIAVAPARAGRNTLTIALRGGGWADLTPLAVTATLSNAAAGIEAIVRDLPRTGPGIYELTGPELAVPGEWTVKIDLLISDFDRVTYTAPIPVR
jgi:copper transport protein